MVSENRVFLLTNLHGGTTVLKHTHTHTHLSSAYLFPSFLFFFFTRLIKTQKKKTYRRNQDPVSRLHGDFDPLPVLVDSAGTDSEDLGFRELLDGRLGEVDAGSGFGLSFDFDALHEDAVEEGREGLDVTERGGLKFDTR